MFKTISLVLEDVGVRLQSSDDSDLIAICLNEFILDKEKSSERKDVYTEGLALEVYPSVEEVKEIIKALQQILPEEDAE